VGVRGLCSDPSARARPCRAFASPQFTPGSAACAVLDLGLRAGRGNRRLDGGVSGAAQRRRPHAHGQLSAGCGCARGLVRGSTALRVGSRMARASDRAATRMPTWPLRHRDVARSSIAVAIPGRPSFTKSSSGIWRPTSCGQRKTTGTGSACRPRRSASYAATSVWHPRLRFCMGQVSGLRA